MLNIVYNHIRKQMTEEQKKEFKTSQLIWLKARDKEFIKINKEDVGTGGHDEIMIKTSRKANYVADRIKYFIKSYLDEKLQPE